MRRNRLVIMLKQPVAGRVKTRLGRDIGMTSAAWWFRHQSAALIRRLGHDRRWQTALAVAPDTSLNSPVWPRLPLIAQGGGDLGARMKRLLAAGLNGPVIIIGGDIPGIRAHHIVEAFSQLGHNDMVFGPAGDGGFWLVGAKCGAAPLPPRLFEGVRWSGPTALADSIASAGDSRIGFAATLRDVDSQKDLIKTGPFAEANL